MSMPTKLELDWSEALFDELWGEVRTHLDLLDRRMLAATCKRLRNADTSAPCRVRLPNWMLSDVMPIHCWMRYYVRDWATRYVLVADMIAAWRAWRRRLAVAIWGTGMVPEPYTGIMVGLGRHSIMWQWRDDEGSAELYLTMSNHVDKDDAVWHWTRWAPDYSSNEELKADTLPPALVAQWNAKCGQKDWDEE